MLLNNFISKKNKLLYKMKILNTRDTICEDVEDEYDKVERYK